MELDAGALRLHNTAQPAKRRRALLASNPLRIDQEAQVCVSNLAAGQQVVYKSQPGRKAYLFTIAGELAVNGVPLAQGDQGRVADETELDILAGKDSELILLDLPEV